MEKSRIIITKKPVTIVTWYNGFVQDGGERHQFWLIDRWEADNGIPSNIELSWFFKRVPQSVRYMEAEIIKKFKESGKMRE